MNTDNENKPEAPFVSPTEGQSPTAQSSMGESGGVDGDVVELEVSPLEASAASESSDSEAEDSTVVEAELVLPELRDVRVRWVGPFAFREAFHIQPSGLYLVSIGQSPLYIGSATHIARSLSQHIVYARNRVTPGDMIGRELLSYTHNYRGGLVVKLGTVLDDTDKVIRDIEILNLAKHALAVAYQFPVNGHNPEWDLPYDFRVRNMGKKHPLEPEVSHKSILGSAI